MVLRLRLRLTGLANLAQLAAQLTGDAHALDRDQPLGRLVVRLLGEDADARSWRATWPRAGVATDELSPTALVLNLRAAGDGPLATHLALAARQGEPLRLTTRQLRDPAPLVFPGGRLFVCENPTIVALAAERLGPACPPLLASEGWPTLAVLDLLDRAQTSGATLFIHGDFDWPGLAIVGELLRRTGGQPWRFDAVDVVTHPSAAGPHLTGSTVTTPWDPALAPALLARGRAIHEEALVAQLLEDLALDRIWKMPWKRTTCVSRHTFGVKQQSRQRSEKIERKIHVVRSNALLRMKPLPPATAGCVRTSSWWISMARCWWMSCTCRQITGS